MNRKLLCSPKIFREKIASFGTEKRTGRELLNHAFDRLIVFSGIRYGGRAEVVRTSTKIGGDKLMYCTVDEKKKAVKFIRTLCDMVLDDPQFNIIKFMDKNIRVAEVSRGLFAHTINVVYVTHGKFSEESVREFAILHYVHEALGIAITRYKESAAVMVKNVILN